MTSQASKVTSQVPKMTSQGPKTTSQVTKPHFPTTRVSEEFSAAETSPAGDKRPNRSERRAVSENAFGLKRFGMIHRVPITPRPQESVPDKQKWSFSPGIARHDTPPARFQPPMGIFTFRILLSGRDFSLSPRHRNFSGQAARFPTETCAFPGEAARHPAG